MALTVVQEQFGFYVSCSGGTSIPVLISQSPKSNIRVVGIACGGAATTDITTVADGAGNTIFIGCSATKNQLNALPLAKDGIRTNGLQVGFAGATTGYCFIYTT